MVAVGLRERSVTRRPPARRGRRAVGRVLPLVPAFGLLALFFVGPILWCVCASLTDIALTGAGASTPHLVGLRNYRQMFSDPAFGKSLWITVVFVVGSAVIGQNLGGLAIALLMNGRHRAARAVVGGIVVCAWVLPELVTGFMWYAFRLRHITLPLMLPGTTVVFTFTFALMWGNFFVPFILLIDPAKQPASVAIYQYFGIHGMTSYGLLAAFSILYSLPVVLVYAVAQRMLGNAFALQGAVKG